MSKFMKISRGSLHLNLWKLLLQRRRLTSSMLHFLCRDTFPDLSNISNFEYYLKFVKINL